MMNHQFEHMYEDYKSFVMSPVLISESNNEVTMFSSDFVNFSQKLCICRGICIIKDTYALSRIIHYSFLHYQSNVNE